FPHASVFTSGRLCASVSHAPPPTESYTLSLHDALPICANSSINFSVTDTNSSRTSEAALWPSTYISPLSNSTPCIRKDRISSKSLMRLYVSDKLLDLVGLGGKSAADKGKDTRDYLAAAFPELNAWERAGADASSAGMVDAGFENQKELTKMQLDNQKEIAEMQNETQKEIAG